jgi:ATP adenylyltransferase
MAEPPAGSDPTPSTPRALWAPWRMEYIGGPPRQGCALCDALAGDRLIVHRGALAFVIMNLYPYNNGHVMVAPIEHTGDLGGLADAVTLEIADLTRRAIRALDATEHPDGYNIGLNLGRAAGAGITDHIHQHVVPRWNGDTNFMPVLGGAKIIGEALDQTLAKLKAAFQQPAAGPRRTPPPRPPR